MKRYIRAESSDDILIKIVNMGLEQGLDLSQYVNQYGHFQKYSVLEGLEAGVDVSQYADPKKYDDAQMDAILKGLKSGVDTSIYSDPEKYDGYQMSAIYWGLKDGVDVSWYADPKFSANQMHEIYAGLSSGVDVSQYADPNIPWTEMYNIRTGCNEKSKQKIIKYGLDHNIDTSWVNQQFTGHQLYVLYEGLEQGLDVSIYADPSIPAEEMEKIQKKLLRKTYGGDFLSSLTSKKVVSGIEQALNVDTSIAKIIAKWYAEDENPNECKTVSEYVQDIADEIEYRMNEIYLNEGMEGLRDIDPKYAEEFVQVADALGIELDENW